MAELPGGTVTFLFSDIESSTRMLRELGEDWEAALAAHNRILRECFGAEGGREVDRQGDAFFAVFPTARSALTSAATAQRALTAYDWPRDAQLKVRMGVHTGEPSVGGEGYLGLDVVRAARICSAAHGGQVLLSESTRALVGDTDLRDLGLHRLKDMEKPERLFQLVLSDLPGEFPAPRGVDRPAASPSALDPTILGVDLAKRFEGLGPRIEQQVRDALAARGIDQRPGVERRPLRRAEREVKGGAAYALAGFILLVVFAALVLLVYLIAQAL
jgi:class 3 adenylate cyclase